MLPIFSDSSHAIYHHLLDRRRRFPDNHPPPPYKIKEIIFKYFFSESG